MHKSDALYDEWNVKKKEIYHSVKIIKFRQRDIIFMKMGANVGFEQDGKGKDFLRPVLVYKKFNSRVFLGIPLTSKEKNDKFHFEFEYNKEKKSYAILSQLRIFDIKRAAYRSKTIKNADYEKLEIRLKEFLSVTSLPKKEERVIAICNDSISHNKQSVKYNILITGSNGQVGSELRTLAPNYEHNFFFTDRDSLDIRDKEAIENFVNENSINIMINTAAYTNVDRAEDDRKNADLVNHLAVKNLAQIAKEKNIKLIHISTDYVFDGESFKPYAEDDKTNPNGVYGETKLYGENVMREINPQNSLIIRTSWVYSSFGANFVKTMLRLGKDRDELGVIFDQVGTPTYARDLAKAILDIVADIKNDSVEIYNYSNEGVLSWYDFAKEIMRMAKLECRVNPIEGFEYPLPAKRPHYSLLNKAKIKKRFNINIPFWKDSLDECLKVMGERR